MGAIGILQRHNYEQPLAQKPKDLIAILLSLLLEAMVGRLQEPCRTPSLGDAGRAWDTHIGCGLAMQLIGSLSEEVVFASTFAAFRGMVEALGKLTDRVRHDREAPAQMIAYGQVLQRFQICVQRSWDWRWGSGQSGEDPAIRDIIQEGKESKERTLDRVRNSVEVLSSSDLQRQIQARLLASRQTCAWPS